MLDIKFIENNIELVKKGAKDKNFNLDIDKLLELNKKRKSILKDLENLKAIKNRISKEIPKKSNEEKAKLISQMKKVKEDELKLSSELKNIEKEFNELLLMVPNPALEEVPVGKDDSDNVEVEKWGKIPEFSFKFKDHITLGIELDILDFKRASKIAGTRTYFLKNEGVLLHNALLKYTMDFLYSKGFSPMLPPYLVREEAMVGTGYFPYGKEQAYEIEKDNLFLIGTSEVSLVSYHSNETLEEDSLPLLYAGQSACFRREAGTYGKDTKGLYRIHQFDKIEQVVICKNSKEESMKLHKFLLENSKEIVKSLGLPFRVVKVCTGDIGMGQVLKHDIEVWMPSRNSYGETHSCSSFFDFQARRSNIKVKTKNGKSYYPYTLNNTAIASPRILIPILELYQQEDGSIKIPEVLIPYMNGIKYIKRKEKKQNKIN